MHVLAPRSNSVEIAISRNASSSIVDAALVASFASAMVMMVTMINLSRFRTCAKTLRFVLFLAVISSSAANFCSDSTSIDSCYQSIVPLLQNEQLSGFPTSKENLDVMCSAFHNGMKCIDEFAKHCMKPQDQSYLQSTVAGAKQMMHYLCDDPAFQKEYLKHLSCYKDLREEWDLCTAQMKKVVQEDRKKKTKISPEEKMKQLCCAKYEFLVCTEDVSYKKCSKEASQFIRNIAEMLSGSMLNDKCKEFKPDPCKFVSALASRSKAPICTSQSIAMIALPTIVSLKMTAN